MIPSLVTSSTSEQSLHDFCAEHYADPLGFVMGAYPWGEVGGPLEIYDGPDVWQREFLERLGIEVAARAFDGANAVSPIRMIVSSGHGIGKGALTAWIVDWLMSTRKHAKGTITANTQTQLDDKTWAAIRWWTRLCLTAHWFEINSTIMYRKAYRESWKCSPQSSKEENSEAFAGQHNVNSTSFYAFDEASAVPDEIWKVAEGGLTDGEPMFFAFGNPTRNTGAFHRAVFGTGRDRWIGQAIDSRTCMLPNKALIAEWAQDYGEDSDFFRVRVRGLPPSASELQFIDLARIMQAQKRHIETLPDEPLIAGVDVSGGGSAWTVCRFRKGLDARTWPPIRITGEASRDRTHVVSVLGEALQRLPVAAMFIDTAFGAAVVERLRQLGHQNVFEVNFGAAAPSLDPKGKPRDANQRAYQWRLMKEWLERGGIPPDDTRLESDLQGPGYHLNTQNQLVLESKQSMASRNVASPDDGDGLSLTFAQPVVLVRRAHQSAPTWGHPAGEMSWAG